MDQSNVSGKRMNITLDLLTNKIHSKAHAKEFAQNERI
jgi:hypothetical protein